MGMLPSEPPLWQINVVNDAPMEICLQKKKKNVMYSLFFSWKRTKITKKSRQLSLNFFLNQIFTFLKLVTKMVCLGIKHLQICTLCLHSSQSAQVCTQQNVSESVLRQLQFPFHQVFQTYWSWILRRYCQAVHHELAMHVKAWYLYLPNLFYLNLWSIKWSLHSLFCMTNKQKRTSHNHMYTEAQKSSKD